MSLPIASVPKSYAGIGSRETPRHMLALIRETAEQLGQLGWCLRSGGAPGADDAFEEASKDFLQEIYLPWRGFNEREQGLIIKELPVFEQATKLASGFHPSWYTLKDSVRHLMARNACQVLGRDLQSPSTFVLCWAKNTKWDDDRIVDVDGGTGLAVRLAASRGIPIYNLRESVHRARIEAFIGRQKAAPVAADLTQTMANATPVATQRPRM